MNLQNRILYPTLAMFAVAMLVTGSVVYYFAQKGFREMAAFQMESLAKSKAELVDVWIEDGERFVEVIASLAAVKELLQTDNDASRQPLNESLAAYVKKFKGMTNLHVISISGETRASSSPENVGKLKLGDRGYFQKALKGEINISDVIVSRATGLPVVNIAVPIKEGEKTLGVITGVIDVTSFSNKFVLPVEILKSGYMYIADSLGIVFAHKNKELIMKLNLKEQPWGKTILEKKQGHTEYNFEGDKFSAFSASQVSGWTIIAVAPKSEVYENSTRMAMISLGLFLLGLVAIAVALFFISRSISGAVGPIASGLEEAAGQVASTSSEVANASQSLSEGASQQAASLEETASSLEELSSMTSKNADNANHARAMMAQGKQIVEKVNAHMDEMAMAIEQITKTSEKTSKIIKTIDEIAFQTNLLALNAAVEAARAGEAGAGFAVVADEVRNLALRAAEAAKDTSQLIEDTIKSIQSGNQLTSQTREASRENMEISGKIAQLIDEIATASSEQANGIGQISSAVQEMNTVTQQTAANAEEAASASEEMNAQGRQLQGFSQSLHDLVHGGGSGERSSATHAAARRTLPPG